MIKAYVHKPALIKSFKPPFNSWQIIYSLDKVNEFLSLYCMFYQEVHPLAIFFRAGEMACAKVPLDELHVTQPSGPQGKEITIPALVSEYFTLHVCPS